MTEGGGVNL
jgi:hypothetical protein